MNVSLIGLIAGGHSGVPRYTVALAQALDRVAAEFPELRLSLLTTREGARTIGARRIVVRDFRLRGRHVNGGPARILVEQVLAAAPRAGLLHFFDLSGPVLAPRRPFVTTIHDVSVLHGLRGAQDAYKRRLWPWALRRARAVVAISQFAKDEAVRHLGAAPERVAVIHSGPGLIGDGTPARNGRVPDDPYLLYVGNFAPNKNLPFLVRAFDRADVPARLLLAGRPRGPVSDLYAEIERAKRRDRIELLGDVDDRDIDRLYRSATALVLPSRYEGFGFTPLEAMTRGCPVVASDIPPVREVSGSGALLLPLDDEAAWVDGIRRIVADARFRDELTARGSQTVARYSWEETARNLCRLFLRLGP
jgi:glycosyltransferase involved in cell wall biosynthesis